MSNVLVPSPGDEAPTRPEPARVEIGRARGRAGGTLNPSMWPT